MKKSNYHHGNLKNAMIEKGLEILKEEGDHTASVIARRIVAHVHAFAGGAPQHDDITLLVIKVL